MPFRKYHHIERLGTEEVEGILDGKVYVFPKLDGTLGSVWWEGGRVHCGSRNRELTLENDNQGFMKYILTQKNIKDYLHNNPHLILYGEWLVPHTFKCYLPEAWKQFYIFDVFHIDAQILLHFQTYLNDLINYDLAHISPLVSGTINPSPQLLEKCLNVNHWLMADNAIGEGIVIKNYGFYNKFGRQVWAKIVREEFRTERTKLRHIPKHSSIETKIVNQLCTPAFIEKTYAKLATQLDGWRSGYIPRFLETVYHDFVVEEIYQIVKRFKSPVVDFKRLRQEVIRKVKEVKNNLF